MIKQCGRVAFHAGHTLNFCVLRCLAARADLWPGASDSVDVVLHWGFGCVRWRGHRPPDVGSMLHRFGLADDGHGRLCAPFEELTHEE